MHRFTASFILFPQLLHLSWGLRIFDGQNATTGQFKYQVGIVLSRVQICSGALISDQVVLTSATCVHDIRPLELHIGALNYKDPSEPGHIVLESTNFLIHGEYMAFYKRHNLALIFLPEPVSGPNITPIRLPSRSMVGESFDGADVIFTGWGSSLSGSVSEESLKYAEGQVLSKDECRFDYGDLFVDENRICLNNKEGTGAPCLGDAGGPMVTVESGDGEATLIGILSSFNENFCEIGDAAIYMRTSQYLDWIELNAGVPIRPHER